MPTVSVGRDRLYEALGETYTEKEFDELCFQFGLELDDVTTEKAIMRKEKHIDEQASEDEEVIFKIEVPANRYDLLCLEGLAQALRVFIGKDKIPTYTLADIKEESMLQMHVKPETNSIRPFVVCAVLRGINFNQASYNSFIDLQDRLHQNICRRRTLVAIGTHDLDTIKGPFTYEALPPKDIKFVPLKQDKEFRADDLMEFYKSDLKLKKFLHIIEMSPVYPVIYDQNRTVLSLPPIINGAHSAITLDTKNVFIECTATDLTKAKIVLNTMVASFSVYCEKKFEVEPVRVVYSDGKSYVSPDLSVYSVDVSLFYINSAIGISLEADQVANLLKKMQLHATHLTTKDGSCSLRVSVPPTRSDVLHACDVMEDVGVAFGFNEIPITNVVDAGPGEYSKAVTSSLKPLSVNEFSKLITLEVAMDGYLQVLTFILGSHKENFSMLNRTDDGSIVVKIANPRTVDVEVVRTSLIPGLLKTIGSHKDHPKPIKIFEVGDVVLLDKGKDVGARNHRRLAALHCSNVSAFEVIHGLVDRVMEKVGAAFVAPGDRTGYYIEPSNDPEFLPKSSACITYKGKIIGKFGVVHPEVLANFDIIDPCTVVELDIECFLPPSET